MTIVLTVVLPDYPAGRQRNVVSALCEYQLVGEAMIDSLRRYAASFIVDSHRPIHEQRFPVAPLLPAAGRVVACLVRDATFAFLLATVWPFAANAQTPFFETPVTVPGFIEAENFDHGGEGVAYHDNTSGNQGGQYRSGESVDIYASEDLNAYEGGGGGGYIVKNFEIGEWLHYTINVPTNGNYNIEVRVSTYYFDFPNPALHIEIDGVNVTGTVVLPDTGSWTTYQWVSTGNVSLVAGTHFLKVVSDQQYFGFNAIRVTDAAKKYACGFENSWTDCGFFEQKKDDPLRPVRAEIRTDFQRDGAKSVRLHTEPGDTNVAGSGLAERNDLALSPLATDCFEGQEHWWAHSIRFPPDFFVSSPPFGIWYVVFDFHQTGSQGQANFHVDASRWDGATLHLRGYGGATADSNPYEVVLGPIVKNVWYDFVYHVRWSSLGDGFIDAWMRKGDDPIAHRVLAHTGPTLYSGQACYLKLANYHEATGQASSVFHDRVIRGTSADAVSSTPLGSRLEEGSAALTGSWLQRGSEVAVFSGGSARSSDVSGATATFTFTGTAVSWIGLNCDVCGIANVSIDGGTANSVNTAGAAAPGSPELASEAVFTASGLAPGTHTMVITVTGTTTSAGAHIAVDAFDVVP